MLKNLETQETEDVAKVLSQVKNWQPVGESNPCDKTENLAS